jgi:hypothetical protein
MHGAVGKTQHLSNSCRTQWCDAYRQGRNHELPGQARQDFGKKADHGGFILHCSMISQDQACAFFPVIPLFRDILWKSQFSDAPEKCA